MTVKPIAKVSNSNGIGLAAGIELVDFSDCDATDIVKLALQANCARREIESYLTALLARLGELMGDDAVDTMCEQFDLPRHKRSRQARTAKRLADVPAVLEAVQNGYITLDHAELLADSHSRCPINQEEQLELVSLALRQDCDHFKQTVTGWENRRMARKGKSRTQIQRARRTAKVFDGDHEMVVLHAEFDQIAGERVNPDCSWGCGVWGVRVRGKAPLVWDDVCC